MLLQLIDELTVQLHEARRKVIDEWSGTIAKDLKALRAEIDAIRFRAGLGPSPVEPRWDDEEVEWWQN
jgi:hypothetical protein